MFEKIIGMLDAHHVHYETFDHEHVHTSKDAALVRGTKLEEAAKALVLKTGSGKLIQCIVSGHRKLDMKKLKQLLGEKNISLAHPDEVLSSTSCVVGTVPPVGNLFDPPMPVYADEDIFTRDHVVFSAGSHFKSIRMNSSDWKMVVQPIVADIGKENTDFRE
jgi:prolyl-tRNA editing enzyme YbaK/EbsC (Cys-tRNA(Pro) deacylase)